MAVPVQEVPMGIFTYRQTKKTKKEVHALRREQGLDAAIERNQQLTLARQTRETELFRALPAEGKAEFRAVKEAYATRTKAWTGWTRTFGTKEVHAAQQELAKGKEEIFRKYDLIP
ncbi:MAG: hypothetical protein ACYDA3_05605 [Gaiellaceae bacterium]